MKTCTVKGCKKKARSLGMCWHHNYGQRMYGDPNFRIKPRGRTGCKNKSCDNPDHYAQGLCKPCYRRMLSKGTYARDYEMGHQGCYVKRCTDEHHAKGFCGRHYKRFIRNAIDLCSLKKSCPYRQES